MIDLNEGEHRKRGDNRVSQTQRVHRHARACPAHASCLTLPPTEHAERGQRMLTAHSLAVKRKFLTDQPNLIHLMYLFKQPL